MLLLLVGMIVNKYSFFNFSLTYLSLLISFPVNHFLHEENMNVKPLV